ncbi:hypothetical protein AB9H28_23730, partial [Salmonella enterica subsp. enterica serovar Kentucky]|uniref:hypothetical protein n=1 Tax=Salmonella enterica TaxID=28901 RepID=UPI003F4B4EF8
MIDESKVKGEYGYIKKPFLKSGNYSAAVKRWLDNAYPNCGDDGSIPNARIGVGCFSRVSFRTTNLDSGDEMKQFLLNAGWKPKNWNYKTDEYG